MTGLKIAAGVATVVMAFVAIIALINGIIGGVGGWFGFEHASLESILGYLLAPLAWVMGVDWTDANLAGSLSIPFQNSKRAKSNTGWRIFTP